MDTASYFQSVASSFTFSTISCGVNVGPESNLRSSVWPVARIFTCVPPTSITSTFMANILFYQHIALGIRNRDPGRFRAPASGHYESDTSPKRVRGYWYTEPLNHKPKD